MVLGCSDDDSFVPGQIAMTSTGASATTSGSATETGGGTGDSTGGSSGTGDQEPADHAYAACAGPLATTEQCVDMPADSGTGGGAAGQCLERDTTAGAYSVCGFPCESDEECPAPDGGNASPVCVSSDESAGVCRLVCVPDVTSCPNGMTCVQGEPPQCMWQQDSTTHVDIEDFCQTACECEPADMHPWSKAEDCAAACMVDLADCPIADLPDVYACTGGAECPATGKGLDECLAPFECVGNSK